MAIHDDGSSNSKGCGAGVMVENQEGVIIEVSLTFLFQTTRPSMRHAFAGLTLVKDFKAKRVEILTNSLLVVLQTSEEYVTKDVVLQIHLAKVKELMSHFSEISIKHIPQGENA